MNQRSLLTSTLLFSLSLLAAGCFCSGDNDDDIVIDDPISESGFLLLQVDYETLQFEAGTILPAAPTTLPPDTLPVSVTYNSPGDFGDITLQSTIDNDTLFFGTIIWAGTGERSIPAQLTPATGFQPINAVTPQPAIKDLNPYESFPEENPLTEIWAAVAELQVVNQAVNQPGTQVGFFTYARSVGVGNPAEWDYYVVIYYR